MENVTVIASFPNATTADEAVGRFVDPDSLASGTPEVALSQSGKESGFMLRFVLIVAVWSIVGTAAGAAMGVLLSYTIGPGGTEGLILQAVSWALFAHLLIGLLAGYILLADRSDRELADTEATIEIQAPRDEAPAIARALQQAGATKVVVQSLASAGPPWVRRQP